MKINDFNLIGITILGSRNGVKVEPGIEDAELSVVDIMGKDFFEKQEKALRLAYEKLDNSKQNSKKEGENQMNVEEKDLTTSFEETCPICNQEPCICEKKEEEIQEEEILNEVVTELDQEEAKEEVTEDCEKSCEEECECNESEESDEDTDEDIEEDEKKEEVSKEDPSETFEEQCNNQEEDKNNEYKEEISQLSASLENIKKEYEELKIKYDEYELRIKNYEKKDFLQQASSVLDSIELLSEEQRKEFMEKCENDEILSLEELKIQVALAATFSTKSSQETYINNQIEKTEIYSAPVVSPNTNIFGGKAEKATEENKWDKLQKYVGKN